MANTKKLIREDAPDLEYEELGSAFECVFCGKSVQAVKIVAMGYGLLHEHPQCKQMEEMDPLEFMKASRAKKLENIANSYAEHAKKNNTKNLN